MKMTRNNSSTFIALFFSIFLLAACGKEENTEPPFIENISLGAESVELSTEAGSGIIEITANCSWKATCQADWITLRSPQGKGDSQLMFFWQENTKNTSRDAVIIVESSQTKASVSINQAGTGFGTEPKVVSCRGVVGNKIKNEESYFEMTFDQPVTVEYWETERYFIDTDPVYSDGGKTVRQKFLPGALGLDMACRVHLKNAQDTPATIDVNIPFYEKKFAAGGEVRFALPSADEKSVWVSLTRPNKLVELSMDDGHVLHDIEMPFAPGHICYNPYNKQLYVLPLNAIADLGFDNRLSIIDPLTGSFTGEIAFDPSPKAHPQWPAIYPYELEFTNDGLGIVILLEKGATGLEWRYIDSANGNAQTLSGYSWAEKQFEHVYRGYNGQKVWSSPYPSLFSPLNSISRQQPTPEEYVLDGKFRSEKFYAGGSMVDMQFSRLANKVFVCTAPGSQCVIDLDTDTYSEVTEAEARSSRAAWDYSSASRSWVYQVCSLDQHFLLLDMDKADCIFFANHIWYDKPKNVCHLASTDQVMVAADNSIWLLNADVMKTGWK